MIPRSRRWLARLGACALVGLGVPLLVATPAGAFVKTRTDRGAALHWRESCVYVTAHVLDPPANLTPELGASAARAAAAAWSRSQVDCTSLELQVAVSQAPTSVVANDQHSNVMFLQGTWCREPRIADEPCYDPSALAITTVFAQQNDGLVLDADMEINAVDFTWGDLVDNIGATGNVQDLQNTLTHEFGHLLGLDHNCHSPTDRIRGVDQNGELVPECTRAPPSVQAATMYASVMRRDVERRTLTQDDIDGVCAIYPATAAALCAPVADGDPLAQTSVGQGGGCSIGTDSHRPAAATAGVVALLAMLAGRRLSARRRRG
jgi:hypothetical protein